MDKPVVIIHGIKFIDLCYILDFAYLGQAQVPQDKLDDFLKAGELLQIRGIKEGRIHFISNHVQHTVQTSNNNRSFEATISSTQETCVLPNAKRPRDDEDISIQEASEIMKMLLESNAEQDNENVQVKNPSLAPLPQVLMSCPIMTPAPRKPPMTTSSSVKSTPQPSPKFFCRFCDRSLSTQARINRHEAECTDNPNKIIAICDICKARMKPSSLTQHKNSKHGRSKSLPSSMAPEKPSVDDKIQQLPIIGGMLPSTQLNDVGTTSCSPQQVENVLEGEASSEEAKSEKEASKDEDLRVQ